MMLFSCRSITIVHLVQLLNVQWQQTTTDPQTKPIDLVLTSHCTLLRLLRRPPVTMHVMTMICCNVNADRAINALLGDRTVPVAAACV